MNIYYLDRDPEPAAQMQCDQHAIKMTLETTQLLSTAHIVLDDNQVAYRATHKNHPSSVWVRESVENYRWLYRHLMALGDTYTRRYGKVHKSIQEHSQALSEPPRAIPDGNFTDPPQCMYDWCKRLDTVEAYKAYYAAKAAEWADLGRPMRWTEPKHEGILNVYTKR